MLWTCNLYHKNSEGILCKLPSTLARISSLTAIDWDKKKNGVLKKMRVFLVANGPKIT